MPTWFSNLNFLDNNIDVFCSQETETSAPIENFRSLGMLVLYLGIFRGSPTAVAGSIRVTDIRERADDGADYLPRGYSPTA